eukprot:scaffold85288_cov75-Phaeocystis_antarctica.AAC.1
MRVEGPQQRLQLDAAQRARPVAQQDLEGGRCIGGRVHDHAVVRLGVAHEGGARFSQHGRARYLP